MQPLYTFSGKVIEGKKRGKDFGYPTANIALEQDIPEGIYASIVTIDNTDYPAATFIGAAEMFGEKEKKAEAFILEFNQDIYGQTITIALYQKLRDNQKFNSEKELIDQMEKDVEETRDYFKENNVIAKE